MALQNRQALFVHLLSCRPPDQERKALPWLVAVAINAAAVTLLLVTNSLPGVHPASPHIIAALMPVTDEPILLAKPVLTTQVTNVAPIAVTGSLPPNTSISSVVTVAPASTGEATPVATKTLGERMAASPDPMVRASPITVTPRSALDEVRARMDLRLGNLNDSIATEETARRKAKDWTIGGKENRWGISPGGLHLGKLSPRLAVATNNVPPPDLIVTPPGRRDEGTARLRSWQEIEAGVARAEQQAAFEQRIKSMRSRVDDARTRTKKNK